MEESVHERCGKGSKQGGKQEDQKEADCTLEPPPPRLFSGLFWINKTSHCWNEDGIAARNQLQTIPVSADHTKYVNGVGFNLGDSESLPERKWGIVSGSGIDESKQTDCNLYPQINRLQRGPWISNVQATKLYAWCSCLSVAQEAMHVACLCAIIGDCRTGCSGSNSCKRSRGIVECCASCVDCNM